MSAPFFAGGQGRSPHDIESDGSMVLGLVLLAIAAGLIAIGVRLLYS